MRDLLTVTKFTIREMVKRKSFIISTIIILLLIVIGFNIPNILKELKVETNVSKIAIIDKDNVLEGNASKLEKYNLGYSIDISEYSEQEIKDKITNGDFDSAIIIDKENENIYIKYLVKNIIMENQVPENIINAINSLYTEIQIGKLGLNSEQLQLLSPSFNYSIEQTEEKEVDGNIFAMMLMSIILFYAIYFCAYQVSSSITTEKTSKIMETLVTSTSPKVIVLGKTIGIGIVGLLQMIVIVGTALVSANLFLDKELLETVLDMSNITFYLGIISIIYFILGYFAYALLYALTGSTVSKPEDIQSANTPVAILAVIGFYLSYFTMMNPTSNLNLFASIFPISSPFCMPFRIMMGLATGVEVFVSIIVLLVTILIIAKIAIKIYSNAILNYGTKMSFSDILKIYKDKNN